MVYEEILYDVADAVATVTLNRPAKLNAWTSKMEQEVEEAMLIKERDERVRVIVLTGSGRGFCAGADMANLDGLAKSAHADDALQALRDHFAGPRIAGARADFQKTYSYFPAIGKPLIAAINGPAAGLGFVLSLYCDIRFASEQAKFTTAFARRGLIAEYGMAWMLPRLVGVSNALDLLYSGRVIEATEALRLGLVSRVIPADSFAAEVHKSAVELASLASPRSLRVIKRQVYEGLVTNLGEAIDLANQELLQGLTSQDFKEGVAAFLEKRAPVFTGK